MAISNSKLQFLLARSDNFTARLQVVMCTVAAAVLAETGVGTTHSARSAYARSVLGNPGSYAANAAVFMAQSTNVAGTITMEDEGPRTSVTDAALFSQVSADWNKLAGVDSGN